MRNVRRSSRRARRALAAAMLAFVAPPAVGQPRSPAQEALAPGRVELSTGLSLDVTRQSDNRGSQTLLNVPLRVGAMASGRFELEGEVLVTFTKDGGISDTGVTGAAHGVYHFATQSSTVPFLLAGAGYGDAVAIGNVAAETGMNVWLLRAGAGVKSFFGRHAALRAEYRFTRYRGSENRFCEACPPPTTLRPRPPHDRRSRRARRHLAVALTEAGPGGSPSAPPPAV